jgi:hypothetical protein
MRISFRAVALLAAVPGLCLGLGAGSAAAAARPAGFEPVSASFVSARTGFVLGARDCAKLPCRARLEKTTNGGRTWTAVHAPAVPLVSEWTIGSTQPGVTTVRFADSRDGWVYEPALWATHDGGRHWQRIILPGTVSAVAASDGVAFASVSPPGGRTSRLYESRAGTNTWTLVRGVVPNGMVTLSGHAGWAGSPPALWATTDLRHWHKLPVTCPSPYVDCGGVAAATPARIMFVAMNAGAGSSIKGIFASANGGRTFRLAGRAPTGGVGGALALPPGRPLLVTLASSDGASFLYRSVNGGRTWTTTVYGDGGLGWTDVAYISVTTGWLIHGNLGALIPNRLMRTINAGASWHNVAIP